MNDQIYTIQQYIESKTDLRGRIDNINSLIDSMEMKLIDTVDSVNYSEYDMNDGQMKVKTVFRSPNEVLKAIDTLEKLKQRYINRLNGRQVILRSGNL